MTIPHPGANDARALADPTPTAGSAGDQGEALDRLVSEYGDACYHAEDRAGSEEAVAEVYLRDEIQKLRTRLAASEARAQAAEARLRTLEALIEPMREALDALESSNEILVTLLLSRSKDDIADADLNSQAYHNRTVVNAARAQLAALPTTDKDASHG